MTPADYARVKEAFLRACELPEGRREAWAAGAFADEAELREELLSLLRHHARASRLVRFEVPEGPAAAGGDRADGGAQGREGPGAAVDVDVDEDRTQIVPGSGASDGSDGADAASPRGGDDDGGGGGGRRRRRRRSGSPPGTTSLVDHGRFTPGTVLAGRYRIVALLGEGGMGEVYRADDLKLGQPVALKFLSEDLATDAQRLRALHEEVRVARQVSHPNVCRVYDIAEVSGHHFICMEYVDGENLDQLLRRIGRLPEDKAVQVALQLCAGLAAIHDQGLLHRDVKPSNILIDSRGQAKIADFGLAALDLNLAGALAAGTPGYMAPEALRGKTITVQGELYSLGLVLYEMFTGRRAYEGERAADLLRLQRETDPAPPSTLLEALDPAVERVILRCLERDPALRPRSARSVAAALPGGDPLAAALAAGETPSPELVAAAGGQLTLAPAAGLALLAAVTAGLALVTLLADRTLLIPQAAVDKPPEVLAERAREALRAVGHDPAGRHEAYGFLFDSAELQRLSGGEPAAAAERRDALRRGRHSVIRFWYRASPEPLVPIDPFIARGPHDPPPVRPGMISVQLDPTGRLTELIAIPEPRRVLPASAPAASATATAAAPATGPARAAPPASLEPPWKSALFAAAGLDPAAFEPAAPELVPPVYATDAFAWAMRSDAPGPDRLVAEVSAYAGRPVHFILRRAGEGASASRLAVPAMRVTLGQNLDLILFLFILAAGVLLAAQNLRTGKGDRRGALRLASFAFAARFLGYLLSAPFLGELQGVVRTLVVNVAMSLFVGATAWMYYVALEPYVRRVWPQTLIAWNRLLAGRIADPRVGRDVLVGAAVGVASMLLLQLDVLTPAWLGLGPTRPIYPAGRLEALGGTRLALSTFCFSLLMAVSMGLGTLLLVVVTRVLVRKRWLTVLLPATAYASVFALQGASPYTSWVFWIIIWVAATAVLVRIGLVAWIAAAVTLLLLDSYPVTGDWSRWYAGQGVFALAVVLALALFGTVSAVGTRALIPSAEQG